VTTRFPTMCLACERYRKANTCDAFPDGIPTEIFNFGGDHRQPAAGDRGLQFKLRDDDEARQTFNQWERTFGRL
jgi:hypothetical protein